MDDLPYMAFVTGSQAYGKPTKDSDIDLVVWVTSDDLHKKERGRDSRLA